MAKRSSDVRISKQTASGRFFVGRSLPHHGRRSSMGARCSPVGVPIACREAADILRCCKAKPAAVHARRWQSLSPAGAGLCMTPILQAFQPVQRNSSKRAEGCLQHRSAPGLPSLPAHRGRPVCSNLQKAGDDQKLKNPCRLFTCKGFNLGWLMGLEPTTTGITILDSTN